VVRRQTGCTDFSQPAPIKRRGRPVPRSTRSRAVALFPGSRSGSFEGAAQARCARLRTTARSALPKVLVCMLPQIHAYWHSGPLSPYEQLSIASFLAHGPPYILYSYEKIEAPKGVQLRDAAEIVPKDRLFFYRGPGAGSVAGFTNLFRYALLRRNEGCWADVDVVRLSGSFPSGEFIFGWESSETIGTAVLACAAESSLLAELHAFADQKGGARRVGRSRTLQAHCPDPWNPLRAFRPSTRPAVSDPLPRRLLALQPVPDGGRQIPLRRQRDAASLERGPQAPHPA
jgi:hypothetical protein